MLKALYFAFRTVDSGVYFLTLMEYAEEIGALGTVRMDSRSYDGRWKQICIRR